MSERGVKVRRQEDETTNQVTASEHLSRPITTVLSCSLLIKASSL